LHWQQFLPPNRRVVAGLAGDGFAIACERPRCDAARWSGRGGRGELPEAAWAVLRRGINGILWVLRTDAPWHDLPEHSGPWQTCHARLVGWQQDLGAPARPRPDEIRRGQGSGVGGQHRQHRGPGSPARRRRAEKGYPEASPAEIETSTTASGRLTSGQRHDSTQRAALIDAIRVSRPARRGRSATRATATTGAVAA